LDEDTRRTLERGRRVRGVLKQHQYRPLPAAEQVGILVAVSRGLFDEVPETELAASQVEVSKKVEELLPEVCKRIEEGAKLSQEDIDALIAAGRGAIGEKGTASNHADDRGSETKDPQH
jgi:F-type H+-transporting ATPase subunit alpha